MNKTSILKKQDHVPIFTVLSHIRQYDYDTYIHCVHVANYVRRILDSFDIQNNDLYQAALVHDIGKIFVEKSIINKTDKLDERERICIDYHSFYGYLYLQDSGFPDDICKYILFHHGVKPEWGEYISDVIQPPKFFLDILRACDIYDALISNRPYRKALSKIAAMDILLQNNIDENIMEHMGVM